MTGRRDEVYAIGVVPASGWDGTATHRSPQPASSICNRSPAFTPDLQRRLEAVDTCTLWPILDRERNDRWSGGACIVLLGDACHPMRPFMAAGGAMAVEDARHSRRCLEKFAIAAEAFCCYEATRIPRVAEVQGISIANTWMRGPTETDWFYRYDAFTAPIPI